MMTVSSSLCVSQHRGANKQAFLSFRYVFTYKRAGDNYVRDIQKHSPKKKSFFDPIVGMLSRECLIAVQEQTFRLQNICLAGSVKCVVSARLFV